MAFGLFNRAKKVQAAHEAALALRAAPLAKPRTARLARKTQVIALAAHIGQAGQKSRIGLPNWGG